MNLRTALFGAICACSFCIAGCMSRASNDLFSDPVWTGQGGAGGGVDAGRVEPPPIDASAGGASGAGGNVEAGGAAGGSNDQDVGVRESSGTGGSAALDATFDVIRETGPTCGNEQQDCCPGAKCTAPFTLCNKDGKCAACGTFGGDCCPDFGCRDSGCCSNGVCVANGGNCEMNPSSNLCHDGACRDCGTEGRTCCGSHIRTCGQGLACVPMGSSDQCAKCGAVGQACCGLMAARFCNGDLVCGKNGQCQVCGVMGGPCCPGDSCGTSMVCDTNKICQPCGSSTELCCQKDGKAICNDGFLCTKDNHCTRCGGGGEVCCDGRKCTAGACVRSGDSETCRPDCGAQGQPCCKVTDCPGGQCDGCLFGLDCDLGSNQCVSP